ncbi:putative DNA topoisomerase [Vibrio nigripulchritudo SO65]|uniref:DNA topoisomerase family protein n=1 Tax=Vibrio nigripulchritudo TaxID=28173 RepID=UPI0003B1903C|nr:topoisomerase DNA-binding C4 zinc finger domain-containing protein [Vibrio nigripulchritudo]CCN33435.1 putative DNA topoisomerase [Vibrio nigripulchritudo AM115]CCN42974.1 putative DNA topoisomerase [Vibrio nigripulchritudo FTn2]CCN65382.1 putative DNA topoisomerase [Vibrio nigripulchritudo POn4]CCN79447.1 putative DNA topoisomerase [Vibrio nigripulchritudo SO65]
MSGKIDAQLFSAHEHALETEPCPQCGGELSLRHGKHGPFLGCNQYPACDYIRNLNQNDGHVVKELGVPCPKCANELVLRQGRYGMFIGCSSYPECHHIESLDAPKEEQAPKDEIACPECKTGHLVERKSRYGKMFYACDSYPKCKFAVNHKPVIGTCSECNYSLLVEKKLASGAKIVCANRKCQKEQIQ